jgi:MscS family membrane protein
MKRTIICAFCVLFLIVTPFAADLPANTNVVEVSVGNTSVEVASVSRTTLTFGLDDVVSLQGTFLGNPVWQYVAALIYVILAFAVAKLVDTLFQLRVRKTESKDRTALADLILQLVRGPVKITAFVILLHIGLRLFAWPAWAANFISNTLKVVVACSITWVLLKIIDLVMAVWHQRVKAAGDAVLDMQLLPVISKSLKVFVVIVVGLVTTQNLGMNITGLLASLSIGGLAVGLAAQDTLSNLFGAVALFADKPFRVTDRIKVDTIEGTVEAIGLRSTRIRNLDGHLVTVPNRTMANASVTNVSKRPNIKTVMNIGVTYDTPADKVERATKIIEEVYRSNARTSDLLIGFNKFENSSLNIMVIHWWNSTDFKEYLAGMQSLNLELKRRFDNEGISFAFPSQTLYLKHEQSSNNPANRQN